MPEKPPFLSELNGLYESVIKKRAKPSKLIAALKKLDSKGYSFKRKTLLDFFHSNKNTLAKKELLNEIKEANDLIISCILQDNFAEAKKWKETRLLLELELEKMATAEKSTPLYFRFSEKNEKIIEFRITQHEIHQVIVEKIILTT